MINKIEELRSRAAGYDIVGIVETWAHPNINDSELDLPGYTMYRGDRTSGRGGGVILYVREELASAVVQPSPVPVFEDALWCRIQTGKDTLLVGLCYRSPASDQENDSRLLDMLESALNLRQVSHVMIMGDFNCPAIDYSAGLVAAGPTTIDARLYEKTQDLLLVQNVTENTRFRSGCIPSKLDYVFTNEENLIDQVEYEEPLGKSDHAVLTWNIVSEFQERLDNNENKYNYWKGNYSRMRDELAATHWREEFGDHDVETVWSIFKSKIIKLTEMYVPLKQDDGKHKNRTCIRRCTLRKIKVRNQAWKKYRKTPTSNNYKEY